MGRERKRIFAEEGLMVVYVRRSDACGGPGHLVFRNAGATAVRLWSLWASEGAPCRIIHKADSAQDLDTAHKDGDSVSIEE